jgi:hypothetical protein
VGVLVKERAMDIEGDKPDRPPSGKGRAPPPGWYPDPAGGGWGRRWWDGARWTEHTAVARPQTVKRKWKWTWSLSNVFRVEFGLAVLGLYNTFLLPMGSAGCNTDRCYQRFTEIWLPLLVSQLVLVAFCGVAFWWSKWIVVKRATALLLPIGMVATWVVTNQMVNEALQM